MKKSILYISFILLAFSISGSTWKNKLGKEGKMKLLYVYDPLCSWCYGFGPVVEKISTDFNGTVEVEIISGGMITGDRVGPVGNMSEYILTAIPRIEKTTGIQFGQSYIDLLKKGTYVTSSEKPSVALCVYKSFTAERAVEYGHAIQIAFYKEGKDLNNDTLYADLATAFAIDQAQFLQRMKDSVYVKQAHAEFKHAEDLGVTGFPALLVKQKTGYARISEGYTSSESIEKYIRKHLASEQK